jgi:hypothetical protein
LKGRDHLGDLVIDGRIISYYYFYSYRSVDKNSQTSSFFPTVYPRSFVILRALLICAGTILVMHNFTVAPVATLPSCFGDNVHYLTQVSSPVTHMIRLRNSSLSLWYHSKIVKAEAILCILCASMSISETHLALNL